MKLVDERHDCFLCILLLDFTQSLGLSDKTRIPDGVVVGVLSDSTQRREHIETCTEGYRYGISGSRRTCCFAPEHTTQGFYDGIHAGGRAFSRVLGRAHWPRSKTSEARSSAGVDRPGADPSTTRAGKSPARDSSKPAEGLAGTREE
ncbi:MAG: hypothetical protein HN341_05030 [Verrucomicrobia bacterium]|nr:hypothetical protein [Verrucomicrobiota bacterium]